jgi:phosphoserine aminotransferase
MATSTNTDRVVNFSAGPATMPVAVLERARDEMLCLPGVGASVMEISHRSSTFDAILQSAKNNLRKLLQIPENYHVIFLQGGSRLQFSMIPANLLRGAGHPAEYVVTGSWSKKAVEEAKKEGKINIAYDGKSTNYDRLPTSSELQLDPSAAYTYVCSNETIQGVQYLHEIDTGGAPLVCDASSDFLCRQLPMERYALLYACAQKNAGPAGVTAVIIRDDILASSQASLPGYLNYRNHVEEDSCWNTPPTFAIYMLDLVTQWLLNDIGGLDAMYEINCRKAKMLYDSIDASGDFYQGHAQQGSRSIMNVTFRMATEELDKQFIAQAAAAGLANLKGHRSVGGMRASIYNAMPEEGVAALRDFMQEFAKNNG